MFKSTDEFEKAMVLVLKSFLDDTPRDSNNSDTMEALAQCVADEYLTGIIIERNANKQVIAQNVNPFVTKKGLAFIEKHNDEYIFV